MSLSYVRLIVLYQKSLNMAKLIQELSVFFPAYNEEGNIEKTVLNAKKVLQKTAEKWEIIIVNDGSKDNTLKIAQKLSKEDKRIRVINYKVNRGYGAAVKGGLYNAKYPWIVFTDSDGQFEFSELGKFIKTQKKTKADLVIGYYLKRKVPFMTIATSKLWELVIFLFFGLRVRDIDCGFKLISKEVIDTIPKLESERGAFISSELLVKAKKAGFKIVELGAKHYPRKAGEATGRDLNVIIKSFSDLINLWIKLRKQ